MSTYATILIPSIAVVSRVQESLSISLSIHPSIHPSIHQISECLLWESSLLMDRDTVVTKQTKPLPSQEFTIQRE